MGKPLTWPLPWEQREQRVLPAVYIGPDGAPYPAHDEADPIGTTVVVRENNGTHRIHVKTQKPGRRPDWTIVAQNIDLMEVRCWLIAKGLLDG